MTLLLLGACLVTVALAALRAMPGGVQRAQDGMHALTGTGRTFESIAACLVWVPGVGAGVVVLTLGAWLSTFLPAHASAPLRAARRRRAGASLLVLVGANLSAQGLKSSLALVLAPDAATLPSGHATLALSSAVAVVMLAPRRWRHPVLVLGGGWATLGCVGVIAAYWHALGDVVAALAIVGAWVGVARLAASAPVSSASQGRDPDHERGDGARAISSGKCLRAGDLVVAGAGAAWVVLTFVGWGTGVNAFGPWWVAAAGVELVVIPALVTVIVAMAARALPSRRRPRTRLGGC